MASLNVSLVSPEDILYEGDAKMVIARTEDGEIGIMAGHVPLVANLLPCRVRVFKEDDSVQAIAVHGGFIEVSGAHLTILSDVAELAEDIDVARATEAKARAEQALSQDNTDADAAAAFQRANARLSTAGAT